MDKISAVFGVTLGKAEVARLLQCKTSAVDAIPELMLPRIKGRGGSSPVLYLFSDVAFFVKHRGSKPPISNDYSWILAADKLRSIYGNDLSRDDVAAVLRVSSVTVSRSANELLRPVVEARGRKGGVYSVDNLVKILIDGRVFEKTAEGSGA